MAATLVPFTFDQDDVSMTSLWIRHIAQCGACVAVHRISRAAMLAAIPAGGNPAGGTCPVATVVISGSGKGDRSVESPEVKVSVSSAKAGLGPPREASNSTGRSRCELIAPKCGSHVERISGVLENAEPLQNGRRPVSPMKELGRCSRRNLRGHRGRHAEKE